MPSHRRKPLKLKLTFFAIVLVAFVATALTAYIRSNSKKAILEKQWENRLDTVRALGQVAREAILVDDDTDMVNYMNLLRKSLTTAYAMVLSDDGHVRVHTDPTFIGKQFDDPLTIKALKNRDRQHTLTQETTSDGGQRIIDISMPIYIGLNPPAYKGVVRIGFDKSVIDKDVAAALSQVDRQIRHAFIVGLLVGIIGALILASLITRPIDILKKGAREIGSGNLKHRINIQSRDELEELADDFNKMAERLGELDQMKQDFVSNVTHELRSPMTSIRGYIDLLLQNTAGPLSDLQRDYLSVVKNSSVRLGRFIDNLLDVAKIESQKLKLTPEPLSLFSLAREMEVLFKPQLGEKNQRFVNAVSPDLAQAFVDRDKIAEVLINLTSNAIKFTPEKGEVKVAAKEESNYIKMSVEDTGPGIPAEMIGKLFNKFEQVQMNQGMARKHKGTGLGLTITKGIVEAHGGKIWIESPVVDGKGTAFIFTLPKLTDEIRAKTGGNG